MEKITSLAKRRGFVFQSSEIYGGQSGAWDYGPLGIELKNRIAANWWKEMTQLHDNIVGLDAAILMHPRVWEASGHVENFTDPLVDCKKCKARFRADQIPAENLAQKKCPECGGEAEPPAVPHAVHQAMCGCSTKTEFESFLLLTVKVLIFR
jgi:glycyl-tRNA synthetase